jgi:hypothetical protein
MCTTHSDNARTLAQEASNLLFCLRARGITHTLPVPQSAASGTFTDFLDPFWETPEAECFVQGLRLLNA